MTDAEQHSLSRWQFGRTVLEGLILAGILYLASATKASSDSNIQLTAQMNGVTSEIKSMSARLENVQTLALDLAKTDVRLDEHERRIGTLESARVREALRNGK